MLVWSGAGPEGNYDLYYQVLDRDLSVLQPRERLTETSGSSIDPLAALGPNGDVGILFDENAPPNLDAYFVRVRCQMFSLR
jgi:hypothetical protein